MKIEYADEHVTAEIEVTAASLRRALARDELMLAADARPDANPMLQFYARNVYPALVAASPSGTLTVDGEAQPWPPAFEQVLELPHALVDLLWWPAVEQANPYFAIRAAGAPEDALEQEKKATAGSSA
jgi:hypothetical protein